MKEGLSSGLYKLSYQKKHTWWFPAYEEAEAGHVHLEAIGEKAMTKTDYQKVLRRKKA